jgi:eukaryotic-like serine/threonine-protein kinase
MGDESIGDYRIQRLIGQGGMGKVYEAEERLSKRRVALKVLHPELAKSEEGRRLFLNEMEILAGLDDPHLVRSLSSFEADGQLVMVLELLGGETLRETLSAVAPGRLPVTETVRIGFAIASALRAAHEQAHPVVHRDLKPENVMVCADGKIKVMDFGIAKALTAVQKTHTQTVGTLAYMSPEQIDAKPAEPRSDLYALGLVLYEMLAGEPPFASASPRELLNLQCTAAPPAFATDVRRGVPRAIERLVFQLLEKQPDQRPASASAVLAVLEPFLPAEDERIAAPSADESDAVEGKPPPAASEGGSPPRSSRKAGTRPTPEPRAESDETPANAGEKRRAALERAAEEMDPTDTLALLDGPPKARGRDEVASREIDGKIGVAIIVAVSLVSAGIGYACKRAGVGSGGPPIATATATATSPTNFVR